MSKQLLLVLYPGYDDDQIGPALRMLAPHLRLCCVAAHPGPVRSAAGMTMLPDLSWAEADPAQAAVVLLPGASDMVVVHEQPELYRLLQGAQRAGALLGALCGGPLALLRAGLLDGRHYTTAFAGEDRATLGFDLARYRDLALVEDGPIFTARAWAPTALAYALTQRLGLPAASPRDACRSRLEQAIGQWW